MAKDIGHIIREMRKAAGMSQMKLADKIGVSYQQVQKYEKGTSQVSVVRLRQLALIFGVPLLSLIGDEVNPDDRLAALVNNLSADELAVIQYMRRMRVGVRRASVNMLKDIADMQEGK